MILSGHQEFFYQFPLPTVLSRSHLALLYKAIMITVFIIEIFGSLSTENHLFNRVYALFIFR